MALYDCSKSFDLSQVEYSLSLLFALAGKVHDSKLDCNLTSFTRNNTIPSSFRLIGSIDTFARLPAASKTVAQS
jgi:hypothetical protein